jgi:hypothetical protein
LRRYAKFVTVLTLVKCTTAWQPCHVYADAPLSWWQLLNHVKSYTEINHIHAYRFYNVFTIINKTQLSTLMQCMANLTHCRSVKVKSVH